MFRSILLKVLATAILVSSSSIVMAEQPTPEERAYNFRTGLFQTYAWKLGQLAMSKGAGDSEAFAKHANDLVFLSSLTEEGFAIPDSIPEGSNAKPEIWQDFAKFQEKAANLTEMAKALTKADAMADFSPRDFGSKSCGSCHRDFKVKD